jgi:hypothetical protein
MPALEKMIFLGKAIHISDEEWFEITTARARIREELRRVKKPAPKKPRPDPQP